MKSLKMLVVIASLAIVSLARAISSEQSYIAGYNEKSVVLPVHVVSPLVPAEYAGSHIVLAFTVTKEGSVENIRPLTKVDKKLMDSLKDSISQWKFKSTGKSFPVELPIIVKG